MVDDVDKVIHQIRYGEGIPDVGLLINSNSPTVEHALFEILSDDQVDSAITDLVVRILVERNVDRDPSFLEDYLPNVARVGGRSSGLLGVLSGNIPYPPPALMRWGSLACGGVTQCVCTPIS